MLGELRGLILQWDQIQAISAESNCDNSGNSEK